MTSQRLLLATLVVVLALLATAPGRAVGGPESMELAERYALLVGVPENEGDVGAPRYAEADVIGFSEVLKEAFQIPTDHMVVMIQRGAGAFRRTPMKSHILKELDLLLANLREPDTVIVALAGRGVQFGDDEEPYFCPIDGRLDDRSTLISLAEFRQRMDRSRSSRKLLFVDAGRNDPNDPGAQARGALSKARVEPKRGARPSAPGTVITFSSCSRGERAFEDAQAQHGIFFRHVGDGLRGRADLNGDGLGTLGELRVYVDRNVRNQVRDQHAALQQPELVGAVDADAILVAFKPASFQLKRAEALFDKRHYDEAIELCSRLLQNDPAAGRGLSPPRPGADHGRERPGEPGDR